MIRSMVASAILVVCGGVQAQVPDFYDINAYRDVYLTFSQSNYWTQLLNNYVSEVEIPADMTVDGVTYPMVGVRFRGNTSYTQLPAGSQKKSFNIKLDTFVPGQDIMGYDHLNLNNGFHDPTFLREFLTYYICRRHGIAPGCNFVRLFINGQYWGVYINVQQPNKDMMGQWLDSNDGNRYRCFPTSGGFNNGRCAFTWLGTTLSTYFSAYRVKQGDAVDLMNFCDILNNTPSANLQGALPYVFNLDQFYRYAACMNIVTQTDSYIGSGKDHFLFGDSVHGDFHTFPFDVNEGLAESTTLSPWYNTTSSIKPALSKTMPFPDWRERYKAHYRTIVNETFNWNHLGPIVNQFYAMISADVLADTKKIYTSAQFQQNLNSSVTVSGGGGPFGGSTTVPGLIPFIQAREAWLLTQVELTEPNVALSQLSHTPTNPTPGQTVTVTVQASSNATSVSLWTRVSGPFLSTPMFDDGAHGDGAAGDGVYGVQFPNLAAGTRLEYYAAGRTSTGVTSFLPRNAELAAPNFLVGWPTAASPVVINEFLARNNTVIADPFGEFEDYVELFNSSTSPVDISGWHLTDDLTNPTKWPFPVGTIVPASGTLLIWCDEDGIQGPLHANFKLSTSGEDLALFASDGMTQLDAFQFGAQQSDLSTGRLLDGGSPWVTLLAPSPNQPNGGAGCGVRGYTSLDPLDHDLGLSITGAPQVGTTPLVTVSNGTALAPGQIFVSLAPDYRLVLGSAHALVDIASAVVVPFALDPAGTFNWPVAIPNDPSLVGLTFYLQAGISDAGTLHASPAYMVTLCP